MADEQSAHAILADGALVKRYSEATEAAGRPVNHLLVRSLTESEAAAEDGFFLRAPGSHPMTFNCRLMDADMAILANVFGDAIPFLRSLDLSQNSIGDSGAAHLALLLGPRAVRLTSLSLRGNSIGPRGCDTLCSVLATCPALSALDRSHNPLERAGGQKVVELMQSCSTMLELRLADTQIDIDVLVMVAAVLLDGKLKLSVCDLENPRIQTLQEEHTVHIGRMLRTNTHLREIYLGKHKMRDDGVRQLVHYLMENKTLRLLDLRCNEIGTDGARHLGELLKNDCQLVHLNLANNRIGERANVAGVREVADALSQNRALSHLDLNHNDLCGEALLVLAAAIDLCSTLESVALFHNHWDQPSSNKFHHILRDSARILPLRADMITSEVDLRIDVCLVEDFAPEKR